MTARKIQEMELDPSTLSLQYLRPARPCTDAGDRYFQNLVRFFFFSFLDAAPSKKRGEKRREKKLKKNYCLRIHLKWGTRFDGEDYGNPHPTDSFKML